ncbi:MAG: GGDEF domain-containing protein [Rhodospirillaceae bacterium]
MNFTESKEKATAVARQAIARMNDLGVSPNPRNFAVWYTYCADQLPDLRRHVDKRIATKQPLDDEFFEATYMRFFENIDESVQVQNAGAKLENTLDQMMKLFKVANQGTRAYNKTLEDFSGQVLDADPQQIQAMIATVVTETKRMLKVNEKLGDELTQSSDEINRLRTDLDKVRHDALTDGLTGIPNRKVFDTQMQELTRISTEDGTPLSLMMVDIDFFKKFNDNYGHQMGDQVLRVVARQIEDGVKGSDVAARYGGEEFAVILPQTRVRDAISVAEGIRRVVASRKISNKKTGEDLGTVTLSIGVSEFRKGESIGQFIQRADEALYMAKREGRNRVVSQLELELKQMVAEDAVG